MSALPAAAGAQPAEPPETGQIAAFLTQLQRAIESDDRPAVAAMIRYPITISIGGLRVPFADAATVVARYDDIFNPSLRDAIARSPVHPGADGYLLGGGSVVVTRSGEQLRIGAISVPPFSSADNATAAPPPEPSAAGARTSEPRRVAIRVGPRPTQIPGLLSRGTTDSFLLYLPKGQLAGVRLERVPAGSAIIRVVHARTGAPLGTRSSADGRFVQGRPSESADYRIDVRRLDNADAAPLPYMLALTLR